MYEALQTIVDPGDEVLLPAPYWTTYPEAITLAGGEPVVLPTTEATGFRVTVEQLEAAKTPRTKALFFVSPGNPTRRRVPARRGRRPSDGGPLENGVWVITDEIYEHLTYGEHRFTSMPGADLRPRRPRALILNGVAKTYAMTGWRVGWMSGRPT